MNRAYGLLRAAAVVGIGLIGAFAGCERGEPLRPRKIAIAVSAQPLSSPVYVAYAKGYFRKEGLEVDLQKHPSGKDALDGVLKGAAQFCTVAETPIMFAGLRGEKFFIIATIAESKEYMRVVGRKDRGVEQARDLAGKRVGVSRGTTAEYFLDALLTFNGIPEKRVRRVFLTPEEMPRALAAGAIDAAVTWSSYAVEMQGLLGDNGSVISNELIYKIWWNIAGGREFVSAYPETVEKLLRALLRAEAYINAHPGEAALIVERFVGQDALSLADYEFDIQLGQALLLDLEEQARWAIRNGLTDRTEVPNLLGLFYTEGLEATAPGSVMMPPQARRP